MTETSLSMMARPTQTPLDNYTARLRPKLLTQDQRTTLPGRAGEPAATARAGAAASAVTQATLAAVTHRKTSTRE